jgi:hypothetical protein
MALLLRPPQNLMNASPRRLWQCSASLSCRAQTSSPMTSLTNTIPLSFSPLLLPATSLHAPPTQSLLAFSTFSIIRHTVTQYTSTVLYHCDHTLGPAPLTEIPTNLPPLNNHSPSHHRSPPGLLVSHILPRHTVGSHRNKICDTTLTAGTYCSCSAPLSLSPRVLFYHEH